VDGEGNLFPSGGIPGERRADERTATMFRPVLIEGEEFAGLCLVHDLSPRGMRGTVHMQFAQNMRVTIQFNHRFVVSGAVVWSEDGQVGVRFDQSIHVWAVLSELSKEWVAGKVNGAPRLRIQCDGDLVIGARTLAIQAQDISQRGIRALASYLQPGDEALVRLEGLEPRKSVVRWTQFGTAGIKFHNPLSFAQLAKWVIWNQRKSLPDAGCLPDPAIMTQGNEGLFRQLKRFADRARLA